jgi:aminomethyltransferase
MALKRTPLYERHRDLGARLVEFGGWEMPVQYTSILDEHRAVRERAGLFDVSHMGEIRVTGPAALRWLRRMITNDPADLDVGQAQYTMLCYPDGGVVDDLIVYRVDDESYLLVVNASNTDKDFAWLHEQLTGDVELENISAERGLLALQGPAAAEILQRLTGVDLSELAYYHVTAGDVVGREVTRIPAWIARTGYTGEDGFEIMVGSSGRAVGRVAGSRRRRGPGARRPGRPRHAAPRSRHAAVRSRARCGYQSARSRPELLCQAGQA